ncbi:uncharacterized protein LOC122263280 [Penaeus japonicus]|uniref:uncharacterized protein LOC122263280 n=1 Tax=Penaeus japonicus TaxID=27405 RepID=UPI001C70D42D|nr:uncharacterized protein LOC122263280 [Penaeus japonicus]
MADFKSFVLFVLLCLPLVQSGGPCVDEAYVEGCPSYRLRGLALSTAYLPHSLSFRAERVSKVQLTSDRAFRFNLTDTTKYQVSLEKNGSRICAAIPGILNETCGHWYYLGIDSTSPLLFTLDCVNASHSCRFHRLTRVALHPGADPSVLTWRNRANTTTLSVGITNGKEGALVTLRNAATGTRSYHNITVRGASGGPPCVFSSPVLNLNYTCKKALTPNDFLFIADSKSSYFDLSAFTPEEDVPKGQQTCST